jgi:hypothetical protein
LNEKYQIAKNWINHGFNKRPRVTVDSNEGLINFVSKTWTIS